MLMCLDDARRVSGDYDLCVVGAGAAGLSFAAEFLRGADNPGLRVAVLDGAGLDDPICSDPLPGSDRTAVGKLYARTISSSQFLYTGLLKGWLAGSRPDYLTASRLRTLGGTSVIWSGWWLPLEDHDLEAPLAGGASWPIRHADLAHHYRRIHETFVLGPYPCDASTIAPIDAGRPPRSLPLEGTPLASRVVLVKRVNFRDLYADAIGGSHTVDLFRNAHFQRLDVSTGPMGIRVNAVQVRSVERGELTAAATISARAFVLAAGALENTRLLLISNLGNDGGHLGSHFCEHPYLWVAARLDLPSRTVDAYPLYFSTRPLPVGSGLGAIGVVVPTPATTTARSIGSFRALLGGADGVPGTISLCWEQAPTAASRVGLAEGLPLDVLGLPRIEVTSDVSDMDRRTPVEAIKTLTKTFEELGLGRAVSLPPMEQDPWRWQQPGRIVPGNHPMGTTRMSARSEDGVVDPQCRVHGTSNLYVLGSSVFPRGGHANPTLTVLALGSRLADHLKRGCPS
jgi:choline dehydrogenase-like flavoprotein